MNRSLGTLFLGFTISAFALAGCGDDATDDDGGDGGTPQTTTNTAVVGSIGQNTSTAITGLSSSGGSTAAFSMLAIGQSAFSVITPSSGGSQPQAVPELGVATLSACETECTGEGDSGSCTFSGCSDGTWSLEGSFSWGDGNLDADYSVTGNLSGQTWSMNVFANLTYTETSVDGTLSTDGEFSADANGQTISTSWDTSITYDAVTWPAGGGCPTSGSIAGSAEVTANGQSYSGDFDYTFDGTCS